MTSNVDNLVDFKQVLAYELALYSAMMRLCPAELQDFVTA